jgi:Trk-type K+ transport systems, membrane components
MNYRLIFRTVGLVLLIEAAAMLPALAVSLIFGGPDWKALVISPAAAAAAGALLSMIKPKGAIFAKEGFAIVAIGWLAVSLFGALPYLISGASKNFVDAFFESVSGFTTTGASVFKDVEILPKGLIFWRSFTSWLGGMGVLVLMLAVLPLIGGSSVHILKAESTGPNKGKIVPKTGAGAKIVYLIYAAMTLFVIILLAAGGMNVYDACINAFGAASTGGFSNMNLNVGAYGNLYFEIVLLVFILLFGVNFINYYRILKRDFRPIIKDEELRFYLIAYFVSTAAVAVNLTGKIYPDFWSSLRFSSFQTASILTSTGFASADFNVWPAFAKIILLLLMFVGASAGSTAGGIKCVRILLLFKIIRREISRLIHPRSVKVVKIDGRAVDEKILSGVSSFFFLYIAAAAAACLVISAEGKDLITTVSSVAASLNNIGPGFGEIGPLGNYSGFSYFGKMVLSFLMLLGRLEIYPLLLLFTPNFWRKINI